MKLYSIAVVRAVPGTPALELSSVKDLSQFGYFQRSSIGEFMTFFTKTVAERTAVGQRQDIEQADYVFHCYTRPEGLCAVIISDKEYPMRVAHTLLSKVLDEFLVRHPRPKWERLAEGQTLPFPELEQYIARYQDPKQADTIMRVQQDLDETKQVLHKSIDQLLKRGEKLDDLVQRSDDLSAQSRMFYKTAKKQNSCCVVM